MSSPKENPPDDEQHRHHEGQGEVPDVTQKAWGVDVLLVRDRFDHKVRAVADVPPVQILRYKVWDAVGSGLDSGFAFASWAIHDTVFVPACTGCLFWTIPNPEIEANPSGPIQKWRWHSVCS